MEPEKPGECQCVPCKAGVVMDIWHHSLAGDFFVINRPRECLHFIALGPDAISSYYDNSDGRNRYISEYLLSGI